MLKVSSKKIYLTRGDTAFLEISLLDEKGDPYTPEEGDDVIFRLKKSPTSKDVLIEKHINIDDMVLEFEEDDTKDLKFSTYKYEIELVTVTGHHFTVIESTDFEIGVELEIHDSEIDNG